METKINQYITVELILVKIFKNKIFILFAASSYKENGHPPKADSPMAEKTFILFLTPECPGVRNNYLFAL